MGIAMAAVAMQATDIAKNERVTKFDTDSGPIGVDNRCSGCISHDIHDFIGPMKDCNRAIKGFGGVRTYDVKMAKHIALLSRTPIMSQQARFDCLARNIGHNRNATRNP